MTDHAGRRGEPRHDAGHRHVPALPRRHPPHHPPVQVLRIGSAALVGLPGEPFAEGGLRIKLGSPTFPTYVVHNTSYAAYVPTREALARGGYETRVGLISKLAPEALDLIVAAAVRLLGEVFG